MRRILPIAIGLTIFLALAGIFLPSLQRARSVEAPPQSAPTPTEFGLRMDLLHGDLDVMLNAFNALQMPWLMQDVRWAAIETTPGQYDWAALDAAMEAISAYDVRVLLSVSDAPDWARPAGADLTLDGPPADYDNFYMFMYVLASRYSGRVAAYEIWPGANTVQAWSTPAGLSAGDYATMLNGAAGTIRAADAHAVVVSGGLVPTAVDQPPLAMNDLTFLSQMYTAGGVAAVDAVGVQLLPHNNPPNDMPLQLSGQASGFTEHSAYFFRHYESVHQVMQANNDRETGIWLTRAGWASSTTPLPDVPYANAVTEEAQADYLLQAVGMAHNVPFVDVMVIDNFNLASAPGVDNLTRARSLIRDDRSARPAFVALARLQQDRAGETAAEAVAMLPTPVQILTNWSPRLGTGED